MSRGLGRVQTGLLAIIERQEKPLNTYKLARMFYQPDCQGQCLLTDAQIKATYRALSSLAKRGKIKRREDRGTYGFIWWRRLDALTDEEMAARIELDRITAAYALEQRMQAAMGSE